MQRTPTPFPIDEVRAQFPALAIRDGDQRRIYFDTPAGTQVPLHVIHRTSRYFVEQNANSGGFFRTSVETDVLLDDAHSAMADLLGASDAGEIIFGQNMTSLTFAVSRSIGLDFNRGDEIILTRMDHDANVSPWLLLARDRGLTVRWLPFNRESYRFDIAELEALITPRTRFAAVNYASNALGTINDVRSITERLRSVGAMTFVDAVQYVPHRLADVRQLGCDFFACSAYKCFGPHQGILWGKREHLERLDPYKVRPASNGLPGRFETGTLSHEGIVGTLGAVEYLQWLAERVSPDSPGLTRRDQLRTAMGAADEYERGLTKRLLAGLTALPSVTVHGITETSALGDRVPTVCITVDGIHPDDVARRLSEVNIFVWSGNYYAVEVARHLGVDDAGGMVRIGLAHYHLESEVEALLDVLEEGET
jgi:cysteine desulfurase family protein (TIGR01976 family)